MAASVSACEKEMAQETGVAATAPSGPSETSASDSSSSGAADGRDSAKSSSPEVREVSPAGSETAKESPRPRKKEDKSIEHILKALNSLQTPEEKLAALCKKYADLHEEHRVLQTKFKTSQKKLTAVVREKDQLQTEHSKSVLAKSKLESLCRELQRHNKLIKEESQTRARMEEEKRKEVTNKFQATISEIQAQMNDHYTKNTKLREENLELANKLKGLIEQYENREQQIEKVLKHKDLESQLSEARLQQASLQLKEEQERNNAEKQVMLAETSEAKKKVSIMEEQEKQLRNQVALYAEKYEEFQHTLAKSNDVFQSFKTEMDKMTKKIKKLEKDTTMWKTRWENSNKALLDMAEEKTRSDKEHVTLQTKIKKLESLCRALQHERNKKAQEGLSLSREGSQSPKLEPPSEIASKCPHSAEDPSSVVHEHSHDDQLSSSNGADTNGLEGDTGPLGDTDGPEGTIIGPEGDTNGPGEEEPHQDPPASQNLSHQSQDLLPQDLSALSLSDQGSCHMTSDTSQSQALDEGSQSEEPLGGGGEEVPEISNRENQMNEASP